MKKLPNWWKWALAAVVLVIVAQIAVSVLVRTHRVREYLISHLERSFGRSVQVDHFEAQILPTPELDADGVTVGEDPAFGNEYFLRAEHLSASLRWTGLLLGHFEFGTLALSRPSLILVRDAEGRWNLERWLPPARSSASADSRAYGPASLAPPTNHLQRIEFDEGRVNFKNENEKLAFAFTGVSGSVEQVSSGRWMLQLKAQPWRSGVSLQSAGILRVNGDIAGTSARLQPAKISLRWDKVSLADLFRLFRGQDYGLRGAFTLEASAESMKVPAGNARAAPADTAASHLEIPPQAGDWSFAVETRASQIHRWDLTERQDNPRVNARIKGRWNVISGSVRADELIVESLKSNTRGTATLIAPSANFEIHLDSAGIQASDLLAWYRAFHPDVAEGVTARQYFTGALKLRGWPLELEHAAFSSNGGEMHFPDGAEMLRVGVVRGGRTFSKFVVEPVHIAMVPDVRTTLTPAKHKPSASSEDSADVSFVHDFGTQSGAFGIDGHLEKLEQGLKIASLLGRQINHGWELTGEANASTRWQYTRPFGGRWNGKISLANTELAVAGLNLPVQVHGGAVEWQDGLRAAYLTRVDGFGATWTGSVRETKPGDTDNAPEWNFQLNVDHLDAADLDRWAGPRARPSWVERLMSSLLGRTAAPGVLASELVRRVNAQGELNIAQLTVEKLKLAHIHAQGALHDLQLAVPDAVAEWAGGKVHAKLQASFSPQPAYDVTARLENINLSQIPGTGGLTERLGGAASGKVHFSTAGVGRDELLEKLIGQGDIRLNQIEFRGYDVSASIADGEAHPGNSRWTSGEGVFSVRDRGFVIENLRMDSGKEETILQGALTFGRDANLTIRGAALPQPGPRDGKHFVPGPGYVLRISGPLDEPRMSAEKAIASLPAD